MSLAPIELKSRSINVILKKYIQGPDEISILDTGIKKPKQKQIDIIINTEHNNYLSQNQLFTEPSRVGKNISPITTLKADLSNINVMKSSFNYQSSPQNDYKKKSFSNLNFSKSKVSSHLLNYSKSKPLKFPLINEKSRKTFKLSNLLKPNSLSFKMFGNEFIKSKLFESTDTDKDYKSILNTNSNLNFENSSKMVIHSPSNLNLQKELDLSNLQNKLQRKKSKNFQELQQNFQILQNRKISSDSIYGTGIVNTFSNNKPSNSRINNSNISSNVNLNGTKIITYDRNIEDIKLIGTVIDLNKAMRIDKKKMMSIYGYNDKKESKTVNKINKNNFPNKILNFSKISKISNFLDLSQENLKSESKCEININSENCENYEKKINKDASTEIHDQDLHSFQAIEERPLDSERDTINNNFIIQQLQREKGEKNNINNMKKPVLTNFKMKEHISEKNYSSRNTNTINTLSSCNDNSFQTNLKKKFPNAITKNLEKAQRIERIAIESKNNYIKDEKGANKHAFTKDHAYNLRLSKANNILISMLQFKKLKK